MTVYLLSPKSGKLLCPFPWNCHTFSQVATDPKGIRLAWVNGLMNSAADRLTLFAHKWSTARRVLQTGGVGGFAETLWERRVSVPFAYWKAKDRWWLGKLIELTGNRVAIGGCTFDIGSPAISTLHKSRFLLGYEVPERRAVKQFLDTDLPVVELGGSAGVVACLTNKRLRHPERHVVVEANPALVSVLERNRALNGCGFSIVAAAVGYGQDQMTFYPNENFLAGSTHWIGGTQPISVPTTSLRTLVDHYGFERCTLICDIEGAEVDLVRNDAATLRDRVAMLIVEVHDWCLEDLSDCSKELLELGFEPLARVANSCVYRNPRLNSSPAAVAA